MVYIRLPNFKTGINPNLRYAFNPDKLTPEQKMQLTRNRIWGNMIGGNARSGYKELKAALIGPARAQYYKFHELRMIFPFVNDYEKRDERKTKYQERKMRIFMRGVKIGKKQGGTSSISMAVFEMKDKKNPAAAQKIKEEAVKNNLSDESLGLSSDA